MPGELRGDEARCRWLTRDDVQYVLAVDFAAARWQLVPEHHLRTSVVRFRSEDELPALRDCDAPPGQRASDFDDVMLCIPAIDAERVQLHQFASVVLVQPRPLAPAWTARV